MVVFEQRREQMPLDVIDADERKPGRLRKALRAHQADQQRADQPGSARDRDTADISQFAIGLRHRALNNRHHRDHMIARGEFRDDSAIEPMDVVLIRDGAGANFSDAGAFGFENRGRGIIA